MKKLSLDGLKRLGTAQHLTDTELSQVKGGTDCTAFCLHEEYLCNATPGPHPTPQQCHNLFNICMANEACN